MVNLVKGLLMYDVVIPRLTLLIIHDMELKNRKCSNKISAITNKLHPLSFKRIYTFNDFPKEIQKKKSEPNISPSQFILKLYKLISKC